MVSFRVFLLCLVAGSVLVGLGWAVDVRLAVPLAALVGAAAAVAVARNQVPWRRPVWTTQAKHLLRRLVQMGDALKEVSAEQLQQRGGWDRALFDGVLARVEGLTPDFQATLTAYLAGPDHPSEACVQALLAVDRLSAAYTYWTRLFPPGQQAESMFVLSLLHDLSDKVEHAIRVVIDDRE